MNLAGEDMCLTHTRLPGRISLNELISNVSVFKGNNVFLPSAIFGED